MHMWQFHVEIEGNNAIEIRDGITFDFYQDCHICELLTKSSQVIILYLILAKHLQFTKNVTSWFVDSCHLLKLTDLSKRKKIKI